MKVNITAIAKIINYHMLEAGAAKVKCRPLCSYHRGLRRGCTLEKATGGDDDKVSTYVRGPLDVSF